MDQVGGVVEQSLALVQRLVDEPVVVLLEIAQPAVDQLRRLGGGPGREVPRLDEGGLAAPGRPRRAPPRIR